MTNIKLIVIIIVLFSLSSSLLCLNISDLNSEQYTCYPATYIRDKLLSSSSLSSSSSSSSPSSILPKCPCLINECSNHRKCPQSYHLISNTSHYDCILFKPCTYNGHHYEHDHQWKADECTVCTCINGIKSCSTKICDQLKCTLSNREDKCCLTCKAGCVINNHFYSHGETFRPDKCSNCTCQDGKHLCLQALCRPCPNPIITDDQCCPLCEDDSLNLIECIYHNLTYKEGSHWNHGCKKCKCERGQSICFEENCIQLNNLTDNNRTKESHQLDAELNSFDEIDNEKKYAIIFAIVFLVISVIGITIYSLDRRMKYPSGPFYKWSPLKTLRPNHYNSPNEKRKVFSIFYSKIVNCDQQK